MGRQSQRPVLVVVVLALVVFNVTDGTAQLIHPPPAAKAPAVPADVEEAILQQLEQQYGAQFRQIHRTEMHLVRLAAEPTKAQYEKIAADGLVAMKDAAKKFGQAMNGNGWVQGDLEPRKVIAEGIAKAVRATLSPEQAKRYQAELDLRITARKRMVVVNLVAMIDRILILRPEQREKLAEILANNWNEEWNQPQLLMYGRQYIPPMPDAKINPILSEAQRAVWQGVYKQNVRFGVNFNRAQVIKIPDEVWDDDAQRKNPDPPASQKAEPKAGGKP
jgi:hypothetical protein